MDMRFLILVAVLVGCGSDEPPASYRVHWGHDWRIAPETLLGCTVLTIDHVAIEWSGPYGCSEPMLVGEVYDDYCSLYPGDGYEWWICRDVNEPDRLVGELIVGGQTVADFYARRD